MSDPKCPDCGSDMKLRQNKSTQESFWGCTQYPECIGTRRIDEEESSQATLPSDRYRQADKQRWRS